MMNTAKSAVISVVLQELASLLLCHLFFAFVALLTFAALLLFGISLQWLNFEHMLFSCC
jgi:hypothetical protein